MELSAAFTGLYISSGRRLALFTCFVVLSLFSNLPVGILFSSVFLMIASFEGQTQGIFFLYFISGIFAACLFQHLEQEFAIGIPLFLSLFCLFLCETANIVLLTNEHLSLEQFLVPAANLVVSGILLLGILKFFPEQWYSGTEYAIWT